MEAQRWQASFRRLELEKLQIQGEIEQRQFKIKLMEGKIRNFKDILDKIIMKLGAIKAEIFDLRSRYNETELEREKLSVRAAVGFEGLTPRPDYRKLVEDFPFLELGIFDSTGRKQIVPTTKIVEQMMNSVAEKKISKPTITIPQKLKIDTTIKRRRSSVSTSSPKLKPGENSPRGVIKSSFGREVSSRASSREGSNTPTGRKSHFERQASEAKNTGTPHDGSKIQKHEELKVERLDSEISGTGNNSFTEETPHFDFGEHLKIKIEFPQQNENAFGEQTLKKADELIKEIIEAKTLIDKME